MSKSLSTSLSLGKASDKNGANLEHNNRFFNAKNVDPTKTNENVVFIRERPEKIYDELFGEAVAEYNKKQNRNDRKIGDYYSHIKNGKREEAFYEVVIQFGDVKSASVKSENGEAVKSMLTDYVKNFEKRNPNLKIFNAVLHMDEASPHLHIDFIPFYTNGRKNGLQKGVSMFSALAEMGFENKNKHDSSVIAWENSEREIMKQILLANGFTHENKNAKYKHMTVEEYKQFQDTGKAQSLNEILEANETELTAENVRELKTRNQILEQDIYELRKQLQSPLKQFYYATEDKASYVKDKLTEKNIPFTETENGFETQEIYANLIRETERAYKPSSQTADNPFRKNLLQHIDGEIMLAKTWGEFLERLQKLGYEIKQGKYIAVKPPKSSKYIRLKSFGEDYSELGLRRRIEEHKNFENDLHARMVNKKFPEVQLCVYKEMNKYLVLITSGQLPKKRKDKQKYFTWTNDKELDKLIQLSHSLKSFGYDISKIKNLLNETTLQINEKEKTVAKLKEENIGFEELYKKAEFVFNTPLPATQQEQAIWDKREAHRSAKKTVEGYRLTAQNYQGIARTIAKNNIEINKLEDELKPLREKQSQLLNLTSAVGKIQSDTYIAELTQRELERRRTEIDDKADIIKRKRSDGRRTEQGG